MKKKITIPILLILSALSVEVLGQEGEADNSIKEKVFTIDNCVNKFNMEKTIETKVGYQYWFVDKEFLDGRTLKMSV